MITVTCYVDFCGDLLHSDTNTTLRRATTDERRESRDERTGTGHILAQVAERTMRRAGLARDEYGCWR
jgi:hypothetical protein